MVKRYTTGEIAELIAGGMDPDAELVLASDYAALEAELAAEVAENVRLRTREVGDEVGNLLQEVADLKNELARVKAESLRVVKDGEECYPGYTQAVNCIYDGNLYSITGKCGGFVWLRPINSNDGGDFSISTCTPVQPVRLERWEANDDHN